MEKIILTLEPATGENLDKTYREQIKTLQNRLEKLQRQHPISIFDKQAIEEAIQETRCELIDTRLHYSAIKSQASKL